VKWLNTADCKSALIEFGGSNPSSSTNLFYYETLAQLVEHLTFNQGVEGSNPSCLTTFHSIVRVYKALSTTVDNAFLVFPYVQL
jgi:hypothetical protein